MISFEEPVVTLGNLQCKDWMAARPISMGSVPNVEPALCHILCSFTNKDELLISLIRSSRRYMTNNVSQHWGVCINLH